MTGFEYKVVPAPQRGLKAKGVKGTPARFANALETVMNELGAQGWEYLRSDTLPVEERQGLWGKTTNFQNMLVFRRSLIAPADETAIAPAMIEGQSEDEQDETAQEPEPTSQDPSQDTDFVDADAVDIDTRVSDTLNAAPAFARAGPTAPTSDTDANDADKDANRPAE